MSSHVADLFADLSLRTTQFSAGLSAAVTASRQAGSIMSQSFGTAPTNAARETDRAVQQMSRNVSGYMKDISRIVTGILISQAFYGLIRTIREAANEVFEFSLMMEQAAVSFEFMMGSAKESAEFIGAMEDFAAKTPFSMDDATRGARRLQAMGFEAKNVIPVMRSLADVMALSGNKDPLLLSRMTITLGQIKNSSRTSAREIKELILAGIPANKILQEELGLTAKQVQNLGDAAIPGEVALAALMRGIEKRYGGAAAAIQKTTLGLTSTIRDNLLFISRDLLKEPMAAYNEFVSHVADGLERIRMEGRKFGTGGIINAIFPPELQTTARVVLESVRNIAQNIARMGAAFAPAAKALNEFLFRGLALILPVIASVTNAISRITYFATHSIPAVRYLGAAILGLLSAGAATAMVLHLAWAIRVLGIAKAVAGAVALLSKAIQVLYLAMSKNPVTALIMLISTALLGLAMSSATVSAWLDRVMKQMMGLMGMNGDLFTPTDDATKGMQDKFNESIIEGGDAWDEYADAAERAGKKVQDNIQSFDEVHQIEEPKGDGGLGGGMPTLPDIDMPDLPGIEVPEIEVPGAEMSNDPFIFPPPIIPPPQLPSMPELPVLVFPRPIIPSPILPQIPPLPLPNLNPDPGPVLEHIGQKIRGFAHDAGVVLEGWREMGTQQVQGWVDVFNGKMDQAWESSTQGISNWGVAAGSRFAQGLEGLSNSISEWGIAGAAAFSQAWDKVGQVFDTGWTYLLDTLTRWKSNFNSSLEGWRNNFYSNVSSTLDGVSNFFEQWGPTLLLIVGTIIAGIILWWVGLPAALSGALAALVLTVSTAFVDTKEAAAAELDRTKTMAVDKWEGIKTGINNVWVSIQNLAKNAWRGITQSVKGYINDIIGYINAMIDSFNSIKLTLPKVKLPGGGTWGGGTIGVPQVPRIPYLKAGAVVTKDQIVRVSEENHAEGVIPLSGGGATIIANALADAIASRLGETPTGTSKGGDVILQAGVLVADPLGLKELERILRRIRNEENQRIYGNVGTVGRP